MLIEGWGNSQGAGEPLEGEGGVQVTSRRNRSQYIIAITLPNLQNSTQCHTRGSLDYLTWLFFFECYSIDLSKHPPKEVIS